MSKNAVVSLLFLLGLTLFWPVFTSSQSNWSQFNAVELISKNSPILANYSVFQAERNQKIQIIVTGYSSTPDQTDSTPYITASGSYVRQGVIAANFLPFGTKVIMPGIFPGQVFVVEDRLAERFGDRIDVWFNSKQQALKFGQKITEVQILSS